MDTTEGTVSVKGLVELLTGLMDRQPETAEYRVFMPGMPFVGIAPGFTRNDEQKHIRLATVTHKSKESEDGRH